MIMQRQVENSFITYSLRVLDQAGLAYSQKFQNIRHFI